jgi:hypothetical protein
MNWWRIITVVPAVIDLVQRIRARRRGKACPDDDEKIIHDAEQIAKTGKQVVRDARRKR